MRHLISINDLTNNEIFQILDLAGEIEERFEDFIKIMKRKTLINLFFQPSTRTRGSFEASMYALGGDVINILEPEKTTSIAKGESFEDMIKMLDDYGNIIVLRHHQENMPLVASKISDVPIINAGDGWNEHPTQTLIDLFTIIKEFELPTNLNIVMCGDLLHSRTVHSLIHACLRLKNNVILVPAPKLDLSESFIKEINIRYEIPYIECYYTGLECFYGFDKGSYFAEFKGKTPKINAFRIHRELENPYVFYMTRLQVPDQLHNGSSIFSPYPSIDTDTIRNPVLSNKKYIIMHPLPRNQEISTELDNYPQSRYFEQAKNGIVVRMALLMWMLKN